MKVKYYKYTTQTHKFVHYFEVFQLRRGIQCNVIRILDNNIKKEFNKQCSGSFLKECQKISKNEWDKVNEL